MTGPGDRSVETKRKLILATKSLIAEQGWSALSNRAIAERAGVNLALINYHFGGKKKLLVAMLDQAVAEITAAYTPTELLDDLAAFMAAAIGLVPRLVADPNVRVLAVAMLEATYDPEIGAAVRRNLAALREQVAEVAAASGLPADESSGLVTLLAALLDGILIHFLLDPDTDIKGAVAAAAAVDWSPSAVRS